MNPKDTTDKAIHIAEIILEKDAKYTLLRAAAMMFLKAEEDYMETTDPKRLNHALTRLDAARSVLWDVINDKNQEEREQENYENR